MALPTTINTEPGLAGHHPPYKGSNGKFYLIGTVFSVSTTLEAFEATDPSDSWTAKDSANNPPSGVIGVFATAVDDDIIHIVWWTGGVYAWESFSMATQTWSGTTFTIEDTANDPTNAWISIAIRSDGDLVVVYNGDTDQVMGGKKERVDFNVSTDGGTTWAGPTSLMTDDTADIHTGNPNCVKASDSDDIHILWQEETDTADPPVGWLQTRCNTLSSTDTLATEDVGAIDTVDALLGLQNGVAFDESGTQRVRFIGALTSGGGHGRAFMLGDTGTGGKRLEYEATESITVADSGSSPKVNGEVGIMTIANLGEDLHVLWSNVDDSDDIYYSTSTDTGDTWSADVEDLDAVACNFISSNIYVRGADTVLAYIFDDGTDTKYNERVLIAGGGSLPYRPNPMRINILRQEKENGTYVCSKL